MATTVNSSVFIVGGFQGTAIFGAGEANETSLAAVGDFDVALARYTDKGVRTRAESFHRLFVRILRRSLRSCVLSS